jgi:hypothetical protein
MAGFARPFATYERVTLMVRGLSRRQRILSDGHRPVQFIPISASPSLPTSSAGPTGCSHVQSMPTAAFLGKTGYS